MILKQTELDNILEEFLNFGIRNPVQAKNKTSGEKGD
jgi:hypothetical protein